MTSVVFTVHGTPAPQGSKTRTKWGVREDNPATRPWRAAVAAEAFNAMQHRTPVAGPVAVEISFYFKRPAGHFRTGKYAGELKPNAPLYKATVPDVDKLARAVGDSISGVIVRDDGQIADLHVRKLYGQPRAVITVTPIPGKEAT